MTSATRDRILDAALALFVAHGVAATRTEDIRRAADVSNGSLFHFFPSKELIAVPLYVDAIASYQSALLAEIADRRPPAVTIRALVKAHWYWIAQNEPRARFLFAQGAPRWHEAAERETEANNAHAAAAIHAWLDDPAQRAVIRPLPEDAVMPILLGPSMMATRAWLRGGDTPPPLALADDFAEAALRGLCREHDQEKWDPVFLKNRAQANRLGGGL
jgi:AcrR family transcriptional regulator